MRWKGLASSQERQPPQPQLRTHIYTMTDNSLQRIIDKREEVRLSDDVTINRAINLLMVKSHLSAREKSLIVEALEIGLDRHSK